MRPRFPFGDGARSGDFDRCFAPVGQSNSQASDGLVGDTTQRRASHAGVADFEQRLCAVFRQRIGAGYRGARR